jgi:predicted flap endonuclease-1-like 5' DNA nuclease
VAAKAVEAEPALVAAPLIEPAAKPAQPEAPAEVPTPDFSEVAREVAAKAEAAPPPDTKKVAKLAAVDTSPAAPEMAPAREAGKATSGKQVQSPRLVDEAVAPVVATGPGAEVIPFPAPIAEAEAVPVADEEAAKADEVAPTPEPAAADVSPEPTGGVDEVQEVAPPVVATVAEAEPVAPAAPMAVAEGDSADQPKAAETTAPAAAPVADDTVSTPPEDETAAMRAIEGTWTPRRTPGRRAAKVPAPEGVSVEEEPVAQAPVQAEAPGKPAGLPAPRGGRKDNLTHVIGILPVIETSLNSIGVFHFDQVGEFSDENVSWLEAHLGIDGRINREHWREQARELAAVSDRASKVAGQ